MNSKFTVLMLLIAVFFTSTVSAQDLTITGNVKGADDGLPLPGVSIIIVGSTTGTSTDFDGNYEIAANKGDALQFNFIGYTPKEVTVNNETVINVTLDINAQQLEDVVVTALGIKREKKALGYAVQDVKSDELTEAGNSNIVGALQGKVAGVQITNTSGAVGASSTIKIRGDKSFGGSSSPLFVVDGVPISNSTSSSSTVDMGNAAADIDPENIASMSVLKGPSATALYGSRGANGVILITTKKGSKGKGIGVSFTSSIAFDEVSILPNYQNSYGQGSKGSEYQWKQKGSVGTYKEFGEGIWNWSANNTSDASWGARLDAGLKVIQLQSELDKDGNRMATDWASRPNNVKNFYETGITTINSIGLSGGNEIATGRLTITHTDQKGTAPNTDQSKINFGWNTDVKLSKKLKFSVNGNYNITKNDNLPKQGGSLMNPLYEFNNWFGRQTDVEFLKDHYNDDVVHDYKKDKWEEGQTSKLNWMTGYPGYNNNPYWNQYQNLTSRQRNRLFGSLSATYSIVEGIDLMTRIGTDYISQVYSTNYHSGTKGSLSGMQQNPVNGSYEQNSSNGTETNADIMLMINKNITENITFSSTSGANYRKDDYESFYMGVANLTIPDFYSTEAIDGFAQPSVSQSHKVTNSVFTSANFAYNNYLFLDMSYRQDWSSTLPDGNRSYGYPAITAGFIFTDAFNIDEGIMQYGKIRLGYAEAGNDTSPYKLNPYYTKYGPAFSGPGGDVTMYRISSVLPTFDLKPERTNSFEAGAEFKFFQNRLGFDLTYYHATTKNQIMDVALAPSEGYSSWKKNAGTMLNHGIELISYATIIETNDFSWDVNVNYSKNMNKVIALDGDQEKLDLGDYYKTDLFAIVGDEFGSLWGQAREMKDGKYLLNEKGHYVLTEDIVRIGDVTPDFIGGVRNTFAYKNFSASALIDFRIGGDIISRTKIHGQHSGILEATVADGIRENGVLVEGIFQEGTEINGVDMSGKSNTNVRQSAQDYWKNTRSFTDMGMIDGSFVKLREVSLNYTFNKKFVSKINLKGASLSVFGRNLALLYTHESNDVGIDPEVAAGSSQGYENFNLAPSRTLGFKLNVNF
ncbi:MAG: SusC/RagA family TonB-linked outer membrane protein [Bacteroidales bacterium]|nr:SusC/RagA family TonB-linked outer membrane protein [Bacteroidales bacterium]